MVVSQIFINNYTPLNFQLLDFDNNSYGKIFSKVGTSVNTFGFLLPFSSNFRKGYILKDLNTNKRVHFFLNKNGELVGIESVARIVELGFGKEIFITTPVHLLIRNQINIYPAGGLALTDKFTRVG